MVTFPLALTAKIKVDASHLLKDPRIHDFAHQLLRERLIASIRFGSTSQGLPPIPGFSVR